MARTGNITSKAHTSLGVIRSDLAPPDLELDRRFSPDLGFVMLFNQNENKQYSEIDSGTHDA